MPPVDENGAVIYRGPTASQPAVGAVEPGDFFYNTTTGHLSVADGAAWRVVSQKAPSSAGGDEFLRNGGSVIRSTIARTACASVGLTAGATGVMYSVGIPLYAGDVVTKIGFRSGSQAAVSPTNWFFALYDTASTPAKLGQTADQTSTAWAANTAMEVALTSPYTITSDGIYWLSVAMAAGTVINLTGAALGNAAIATGVATGQKPLAQTSGSSLTETAPATITSGTASVSVAYAWVL